MILQEDLLTKEDYQRALFNISNLIDKAVENLNFSKKQIRLGYTKNIRSMIKFDIKSRECQQGYIISYNPDYEAVFTNYDINLATYERLLRIREDILRLMSMSQTELKIQ